MWTSGNRFGNEVGELGLSELRRQMTDSYRSQGIQNMVLKKRKLLLWSQTKEEIKNTLDTWSTKNQRDMDENGYLVLRPDLERIEGLAAQKDSSDFDLQMMRQLKKLCEVFGFMNRIRDEDFHYLLNDSNQLFAIFNEAFRGRHRDYEWWHQTTQIFLYLSYLCTVEMNAWLFTQRRLLPDLVESLFDLRSETANPQYEIVVEANHMVLLILGNVVWRNNQIAVELRRIGIAEALTRVSPLSKYDGKLAQGVGYMLVNYVREVPALDEGVDAGIFAVVEECLCLDLKQFGTCLEYIFEALPNLARFLGNQLHCERRLLRALLDKLGEFERELLEKFDSKIQDCFEAFTRGTALALGVGNLKEESILFDFVNDERWGTLAVRLLTHTSRHQSPAINSKLLRATFEFWGCQIKQFGENALDYMPRQIPDFAIELLISTPLEPYEILGFLHFFFKVALSRDMNEIISKHRQMIPRCLELIEPSNSSHMNCELSLSVLVLLDNLMYFIASSSYDGPPIDTLFALSGCYEIGLNTIRYYTDFAKNYTSMDIEINSLGTDQKVDLLKLNQCQEVARSILSTLSSDPNEFED